MIHNLSSNKNKDHDDNCSQKNHAKRISGSTKLNIALHAIRRQHTVTEISKQFDSSRTTGYKQQDKALDAANKAFDKDEVLFYIPVTKSFIQQAVISLRLICESSKPLNSLSF